jgi:hypothetical protein
LANAGTAGVLDPAATDDSSEQEANPDTDTSTDTATLLATSTQSVSAPANDNNADQTAATQPGAETSGTLLVEEMPETPPSELAPTANDNAALRAFRSEWTSQFRNWGVKRVSVRCVRASHKKQERWKRQHPSSFWSTTMSSSALLELGPTSAEAQVTFT